MSAGGGNDGAPGAGVYRKDMGAGAPAGRNVHGPGVYGIAAVCPSGSAGGFSDTWGPQPEIPGVMSTGGALFGTGGVGGASTTSGGSPGGNATGYCAGGGGAGGARDVAGVNGGNGAPGFIRIFY